MGGKLSVLLKYWATTRTDSNHLGTDSASLWNGTGVMNIVLPLTAGGGGGGGVERCLTSHSTISHK